MTRAGSSVGMRSLQYSGLLYCQATSSVMTDYMPKQARDLNV